MTYLVFTDFKLFCGLYELLLEEGLSGLPGQSHDIIQIWFIYSNISSVSSPV